MFLLLFESTRATISETNQSEWSLNLILLFVWYSKQMNVDAKNIVLEYVVNV